MTGSCPDLLAPPPDCPSKVFPDNVVIGTQAAADALEGYTEIDGAVTIIQTSSSDPLRNLDALHCLQKTRFEVSVNRTTLTSLDGLRELTEIGGWLVIDDNETLKLGCGLRKVSKIGTHSGTPYVEFQDNSQLDRIELPAISGASDFRIEDNAMLRAVVGSPKLISLGQFFIRANPVLTSVSGFDGLMTAREVRLDTNPMLPICEASKIIAGLTEPPSLVVTSGNLGDSCP